MSLKSKAHSFVIDGHEFWEDNIQLIIIHLLPSQNSHLLHHVPGRDHISALYEPCLVTKSILPLNIKPYSFQHQFKI